MVFTQNNKYILLLLLLLSLYNNIIVIIVNSQLNVCFPRLHLTKNYFIYLTKPEERK